MTALAALHAVCSDDLSCLADYDTPGFTNCNANYDLPVGYYPPPGPNPFRQGDPTTPAAVAAPASSQCQAVATPVAQGVTYYWAGGAPAATATASPTANGNQNTKDGAKTGSASPRRTPVQAESQFFPSATTIALCAGLLIALAV